MKTVEVNNDEPPSKKTVIHKSDNGKRDDVVLSVQRQYPYVFLLYGGRDGALLCRRKY